RHLTFCLFRYSFSNDAATTAISTLSLHDALPISWVLTSGPPELPGLIEASVCTQRLYSLVVSRYRRVHETMPIDTERFMPHGARSEEHTSELQSRENLVCRLLLEKKKDTKLPTMI